VTADGKNVRDKIAAVDQELADTAAVVGAGTVLDAPTAQSVIDAGAEFILAPDCNPDMIHTCNRRGVIAIPGVMTPTEAVTAIEAGADILKLFPAATVGAGHVSSLQGPFGDVDIMPTGGITPKTSLSSSKPVPLRSVQAARSSTMTLLMTKTWNRSVTLPANSLAQLHRLGLGNVPELRRRIEIRRYRVILVLGFSITACTSSGVTTARSPAIVRFSAAVADPYANAFETCPSSR